jgi:phytoene synthase
MSTPRPSMLPAPLPPPPGASRAEEDRYLWQAFRHHSRTFSLATRLLHRDVRLPIAVLYLYCRTVDTIADERVLEVGPDAALREVDTTRARLDDTLAGRPPDGVLWQRLAEIHERFGLPPGPLHELLDGAVWDLEGRTVTDVDDLLTYSGLVAGSVGAMMLPFLVDDRAEIAALEPTARALGEAMQITNILRDVGEDLTDLGRLYLPADALDRFGLARADLLGIARNGHGPGEAYAALLESIMAQAEWLYAEAEAGIRSLPFRSRLGIEAAARMYREILNEVRAAGYDNLRRRNYVPLPRKLRLVVHDAYDRRKAQLLPAPNEPLLPLSATRPEVVR